LAAAREPDDINPQKRSSANQFFIIDGRDYAPNMLRAIEKNNNRPLRYKVADSLLQADSNLLTKRMLDSLMNIKDFKTADKILDQVKTQTDSIIGEKKLFRYSEQQMATYASVGGAPLLDGKYTIFGEVISGIEIIEAIAAVEADENNRPRIDIHIIKAIILDE
jgi:cyclophilin family peptidyl-prolyl cis-trans isomerase